MESVALRAIDSAQRADIAYCKFITPNDTGQTGGHQAGYHLHIESWPLFFDSPGQKGANKDKFVRIRWQDSFETESRFIYYGAGTRNEYRLTRFGKGFPFLKEENVGDLLVLCRFGEDYYEAYVLQTDDEIEEFLSAFGLSPTQTNRIIPKQVAVTAEEQLLQCFLTFIESLTHEFPATELMAYHSRRCFMRAYSITIRDVARNPDSHLIGWIEAEYQLFKTIENHLYGERIKVPFESVEELVEFANIILNRRKSRAGRSLEHHLSEIFRISELSFSAQGVTEGNKRPDFIFPGIDAYHDSNFDPSRLTFLASKTTCKDRWRQILNEADKIQTKYLFTLQQGISSNQLAEMYSSGVRLVVPAPYLKSFPPEHRDAIYTLDKFIAEVQAKT
ncbi:MAG TPA: type II restriction endonuclease [Cyclobacteriaceae bacterium]|nr:type II restriction endonuclease [Cyclobacteriaceae bacterium]